MRCVARRALAHVPTLSTYHLHQNLSHNAISSVEALGTASPDCFVTPESTSDRAAFSSRIKCGPKFGNLTTLDISHNALHSLLGAIQWEFVSSSELQFRVATGNNTHQYFDPPDIRMPVGFGASLSFLNATSNPRLAPVEEPTSGLELVKGSSLPDSIGRAAPKYNENRSIVRCDTIQYFGAHTGSVPTQDASDIIKYRWVDLIPSPNVSLDIPVDPGWMSYWHCMSPRKTQPRFSRDYGLATGLATATELRWHDDNVGYS